MNHADIRNILFLDLETTGTNEGIHSVIEVCAKFYVDGKQVAVYSNKMGTSKEGVDLGAMTVNKRKVKQLLSDQPATQVAYDLADWLVELKEKKAPGAIHVCGHNPGFDVKFIIGFLEHFGITGVQSILSHKVLDTFGLAAGLILAGILKVEKTSLEGLAKALNIDLSNRTLHRAEDDVDLTIEVYFKMINLLRKLNGRQKT